MRLGGGVAFLGVATLSSIFGLGLCLWALYLWLAVALGPAGAAAVIGVMLLCLAGGLAWIAITLSR